VAVPAQASLDTSCLTPTQASPAQSPQVSCVSGAPDPISDDVDPISRLHVTSPHELSAHAAAPSPAESDDEVPIPRFSHRTALLSCYGDAEVLLPRPGVSCLSSSPSPPFVRPQPALQADDRSQCLLGYG
jgi:hypothetical protein